MNATAVLSSIAVVVVLSLSASVPSWAWANEQSNTTLAAELLVVRDDLVRLNDTTTLPPAHVRGLRDRVQGALGLLPWLLRQAGDMDGAEQLRGAQQMPLANSAARLLLIQQLDRLIAHHQLDLASYAPERLTPKLRREAIAIHDTYCAGCHDDAGQGSADVTLPARDLFVMAQESQPTVFLARLINGVKGDQELLFTNPLTRDQIAALWRYYQQRPH